MAKASRTHLRLVAPPAAVVALASLPCRVCGAVSGAPEVVLTANLVAYCTVDHARLHGWPWLQSEAAPVPVAGQAGLFAPR